MQVVIDIPDERYKLYKFQAGQSVDSGVLFELKRMIANGTPLPKGHGRLIDAELLLNEIHDLSTEPMADLRFRLRNAPTTIEADTESKEDDLDSMLEDLWNATESEEEK